jgi:ppGpp synthetase/RelA/SpoT-type nucleotidyltranferase
MPQILKKLVRFPGMDLSNMQDIGGCRAILPDQATVERVRRRIVRNRWEVRGLDDYVTSPRSTGYRSVHVRVKRAGRLIEIQLRTPSQHLWAEGVEGIDLRKTYGLKDGTGPKELVAALERSAYAMQQESLGVTLGDEFDAQFAALRDAARRFL